MPSAVVAYHRESVSIAVDLAPLQSAARAASAYCVVGVSGQDDRRGSQSLYNTMVYIGHYARWDVVSLNLREDAWSPVSQLPRSKPSAERLAELAEKYGMRRELLEALLKELAGD